MNTYESQAGEAPTTDQQVHIYCPDCDYDVTGLAENRCPECGQEFDSARLSRWATEHLLPPTVGPRRDVGYMTLANQALFQPARLARNFPPHPSFSKAFWYASLLKLSASFGMPAMVWIAYGFNNRRYYRNFIELAFIQCPVLLFSMICELIITALLTWWVAPRGVERSNRFRFWYATCSCFCVHLFATSLLLMTLSLTTFCVNIIAPRNNWTGYMEISRFAIPILTTLWWWHCLGTAISTRGLPSTGRTATVFLIPFVGFIALVLGAILYRLQMIMLLHF